MKKEEKCILCGASNIKSTRQYLYNRRQISDDYSICKNYVERRTWLLFNKIIDKDELTISIDYCCNCDLLFSNPRFTEAEIIKKYEFLNKINATDNEYMLNPIRKKEERALRIHKLLKRATLKNNLKPENSNILDIGGQYGHNLRFFTSYNKYICDYEKHNCYSDIVYFKNLESINIKFDIIMSNHTVEHLTSFESFFNSSISLLSDNGIFYIEVPLGSFRDAYNLKEPMSHFNFFSEQSLFNLIKRFGLNIISVSTNYQWVTTGNEWCINLIASKSKDLCYCNPKQLESSDYVKNNLRFYLPIIYFKFLYRLFKNHR